MNQMLGTKTINKTIFPSSSVAVTYKTKEGSWRGFVMPYDITYEGDSKEKVSEVLNDMTELHLEALKQYGSPEHLSDRILSDETDLEKLSEISSDLFNKLLIGKDTLIETPEYYAEVKFPTK